MPPDLPESRRDAYVTRMMGQLRELTAALNGLEARVAATEGKARDEHKKGLAGLRDEARSAEAKLAEVKAADEPSWDRLMAEMDEVWTAFRHSANYFQSQL